MGNIIAFLPAHAGLRHPGAPDAGIRFPGMFVKGSARNLCEEKA